MSAAAITSGTAYPRSSNEPPGLCDSARKVRIVAYRECSKKTPEATADPATSVTRDPPGRDMTTAPAAASPTTIRIASPTPKGTAPSVASTFADQDRPYTSLISAPYWSNGAPTPLISRRTGALTSLPAARTSRNCAAPDDSSTEIGGEPGRPRSLVQLIQPAIMNRQTSIKEIRKKEAFVTALRNVCPPA